MHIDIRNRGAKQGGNLLLAQPDIAIASHKSNIYLSIFRVIDNNIVSTKYLPAQDSMIDELAVRIRDLVQSAKVKVAREINSAMVETNWEIGRHIVEFEQNGNATAKYGSALLTELLKRLTATLGKGFSKPNVYNMRRFYLVYTNFQTLSRKLTWSHICELLMIVQSLALSKIDHVVGELFKYPVVPVGIGVSNFAELDISAAKSEMVTLILGGINDTDYFPEAIAAGKLSVHHHKKLMSSSLNAWKHLSANDSLSVWEYFIQSFGYLFYPGRWQTVVHSYRRKI